MRTFHIGAVDGEVKRFESNESQTPVSLEITDRFGFDDEGNGPVAADRKTRTTTLTLKPKDGKGAVKRQAGTIEVPFIPLYGKRKGETTWTAAAAHSPSRPQTGEAHYSESEQAQEVTLPLR